MFGETTISYVKVWNHPIETTIYKWLFGVPGIYHIVPWFFQVDFWCISSPNYETFKGYANIYLGSSGSFVLST